LAATRAIHIASCLLIFGTECFQQLIVNPAGKRHPPLRQRFSAISRTLLLISIPICLLSGIAWIVLLTMDMASLPLAQAIHPYNLDLVLNQTHFGNLWKLRSLLWVATAIAAGPLFRNRVPVLIFSSLLVASLAWAGHGQHGHAPHLLADNLHLLITSVWPIGLLPFALLFQQLRRSSQDPLILSAITQRFSRVALFSAAGLTLTGLTNSYYMLHSPSDLVHTPYGQTLFLKIIIFALIVILGAINWLYLTKRIARRPSNKFTAWLQWNVLAELLLTAALLLIVGILGLLAPGQ
jgi:putative copper export protein